jgi:sugar phosphate isomerase/epimerase
MRVGIFARTFPRQQLEETLDRVRAHGIDCVQFNMTCAGLPSMPDAISPELCDRVRRAHEGRGITMAAVSGTFNMIDPSLEKRQAGLRRLKVLAGAARRMGTGIITLSTGTRHPTDLWSAHPENSSAQAWGELVESLSVAVQYAEDANLTLAFEPEVSNVIDDARRARRLLDEIRSPRLKVVMDGANLFHRGELPRMRAILTEAFELLGPNIVLAHAKDLNRDGEAGHEAAGTGLLDYDLYIDLLHSVGYSGPLVLHGLAESQVEGSVRFLREKLEPARSN